MPLVLPPFPFMAPYAMPLPTAPPNLDQLTEEELRAMEGNERRHIEERIKVSVIIDKKRGVIQSLVEF